MSVSNTTPKPILEALQKALSSGPAHKLDDAFHKPRPQLYYSHNGSFWVPSLTKTFPPLSTSRTKNLRLLSWNIDMLVGFAEARMSAALQHLSTIVESTSKSTPIVIFLQEMSQSDMRQIREASWIQRGFFMTDLDERKWLSPFYGTTTLVDRRLNIIDVFRVPWISKFDRDGLFVDLAVKGAGGKVRRVCNTHLESLVADPPVRPLQLGAAAPYLHDEGVAAGVLAGDLNAIQPFDRTLHWENGLKDAYLELGGEEDSDEGYTWGQQVSQALRERFGCSRMDKVLFTGAVAAKNFERVGVDVKVAEEETRQEMREAGEEEWVTDHYGVMADFELAQEVELTVDGGSEDEILRSKLT